MLLRTLTALVGLALLFGVLWGGLPWVFLLTLLAALLGLHEFYRLHPPVPRQAQDERGRDASLQVQGEVGMSESIPDGAAELATAHPDNSAPGELARDRPDSPIPGELATVHPDSPIPDELVEPLPETPAATPLPVLVGTAWVAALVVGGAAANGLLHFWAISLGIFLAGGFVALLWLIAFYHGPRWPVAAAYLAGGPLYVGMLLAHVMLLAQVGDNFFYANPTGFDFLTFPDNGYDLGRNWLIFALLTTFATDTGAYLVGRAVGRHRMAPGISPNKTWEGAVGGFVGAVVAALLLERILNLGLGSPGWTEGWNWQPLLIGATVGIVSQAGDLFESRLKRLSQVKDSGVLMPGHGGILDRLDSLLVTIPAVYYLLVITS